MKLQHSVASLSLLAMSVLAYSSENTSDVQMVHLAFHGGPASYRMAMPANGHIFKTDSDMSVNLIDAPDYNAISQCVFVTDGPQMLLNNIGELGQHQVVVGPPQPIRSVSCMGACSPMCGECQSDHVHPIGQCCNGFCSDGHCAPWNISTS